MTDKAKAILERVAREIEAEPLRIDMRDYWLVHGAELQRLKDEGRAPACGIVGCIAGWVCVLHDRWKRVNGYRNAVAPERAQEILMMTEDELRRLFHVEAWPRRFCGTEEGTLRGNPKPGTPKYAAVVATRIRFFSATDGTDRVKKGTEAMKPKAVLKSPIFGLWYGNTADEVRKPKARKPAPRPRTP